MVPERKPSLLIVEDERNVGSTLKERFEREGYDVSWAETVEDAKIEINGRRFDVALLDVGLPDGDGFTVAKYVRAKHSGTAILFLTAFTQPEDRVRGLELGAEDYVAKPFHLKELILRVQNGLKRARYLSASEQDGAAIGQARVHFSRFTLELSGVEHPLTHKECALLRLLVDRRGKAVSRDEILNEVWSPDEVPNPRTIDNFILRIRKLVESDPENPTVIRSIRGVGYQLS